jgi:hypothetical protein
MHSRQIHVVKYIPEKHMSRSKVLYQIFSLGGKFKFVTFGYCNVYVNASLVNTCFEPKARHCVSAGYQFFLWRVVGFLSGLVRTAEDNY